MTEDPLDADAQPTEDQIDQKVERLVGGFTKQLRSPVLHWPEEAGLAYKNVSFPALDGVPLEGWFIPRPGSRKLVVVNHPMGFSRSGLPSQLEPWRSVWASSGNDFEVDFIPDYKILHEAGYNVLAYDLRNLGLSGAANGGIASSGIFEARDVAGALRYADVDPRFAGMDVGLFSRCLGCNSTLAAAHQFPEIFSVVRVLVGVQPVTTRVIVGRQLRLLEVPDGHLDDVDARLKLSTGIGLNARRPRAWATGVHAPTMLYQVRDDVLTDPSDVQAIYDNIGTDVKTSQWIYGTTRRWDGYLEFQRRPGPALDWFARHF